MVDNNGYGACPIVKYTNNMILIKFTNFYELESYNFLVRLNWPGNVVKW